jgi:catechol 2,3-dioxygenase-like lactoylglutathione lyase family enzyme
MLNELVYVTLHVTDQDHALTFYTDALGLEKRADYSGAEGRFLTAGVPEVQSRSSCGRSTPLCPERRTEWSPASSPVRSSSRPTDLSRSSRHCTPAASPSRRPSPWTLPLVAVRPNVRAPQRSAYGVDS